jgi:NAD(P)-dependent dehydrogenase (short-subunit alcohol dehydrogenase family)
MTDISAQTGGRLAGKHCVVTGGARGIGRAIVERFAQEGAAAIGLIDVDRARGEASAAALGATFLQCDIGIESQVGAAMRSLLEEWGRVDILVNNAGINAYYDATTMTVDEWESVFAVDLKGAWLCAKHVIPKMRERGEGSIVNIASIHALMTVRGMFPYAAAKAGIVGLTRSLALDVAEAGIRVNAVCPGWVRTALVQEWFDAQPDPAIAEQSVLAVQPLGRIGRPEEIASFVSWVASDEASFATGAAFSIDGGLSARFAT